jgi:xanthine dehydrogenase accessory factor
VRAAAVTSLDGNGEASIVPHGERAEVDELIRAGRNTIVEREGKRFFVEVLGPPPRLLVFGGLDTAEALCAAAKLVGWRTIVADARARFATRERVPSADELVVGWPEEVLARVRPDHDTAVVVLTHDDRFDVPALLGALATDAFYIAALGSRRNQERRRELLREAGVAEDDLERIAGPAGLDIGAESPAETAVSILGEALARRSGRAGGPLKEARGRIHVGGD